MAEKIVSMKFGGTSVASAERRAMIVDHVRREMNEGNRVALVVSAMGRRGDPYATDTLLDLMRNMGGTVEPRNYSFLFVTGEMISVGVMVHTLQQAGLPAISLTGGQAGVITEDFHMSANPARLNASRLKKLVAQGIIPVVTGGQGVTKTMGDFSILGRGGSDTSGVLVGAMLNAARADIYTDVEYMLAMDPRIVPGAPKREEISFEAALEMARFGSKVVHPRAVKVGMEKNLPIRIRSTFSQNPGTLISEKPDKSSLVGFALIANANIALVNKKLGKKDLAQLEQHVGLLTFKDTLTREMVFAVPAGDTLGEVDHELAAYGVKNVAWEKGYALVSFVGTKASQKKMDKLALKRLKKAGITVIHHDLQSIRSTFVVPEGDAKSVLETLYDELQPYL